MAKVFGAELAKQIEKHRQCLVDAQDRRDERIGAGWTDEDDCFYLSELSSKAYANAICNSKY